MAGRDFAATQPLRIVDLCTGSGCISLLLHSLLACHFPHISILGVDSAPEAVHLAKRNLRHNVYLGLLQPSSASRIEFRQGDVLTDRANDLFAAREEGCTPDSPTKPTQSEPCPRGHTGCDILISNPPYISPASFRNGTTARSVRFFEPKTALVPPTQMHNRTSPFHEDLFYHHIVSLSFKLPARLTVLECGDHSQAQRVAALCKSMADNSQFSQPLIQMWSSDGSSDGLVEDIPPNTAYGPYAVVMQLLE